MTANFNKIGDFIAAFTALDDILTQTIRQGDIEGFIAKHGNDVVK